MYWQNSGEIAPRESETLSKTQSSSLRKQGPITTGSWVVRKPSISVPKRTAAAYGFLLSQGRRSGPLFPDHREMDDGLHGLFHVLPADPFQPRVERVLAGEDV